MLDFLARLVSSTEPLSPRLFFFDICFCKTNLFPPLGQSVTYYRSSFIPKEGQKLSVQNYLAASDEAAHALPQMKTFVLCVVSTVAEERSEPTHSFVTYVRSIIAFFKVTTRRMRHMKVNIKSLNLSFKEFSIFEVYFKWLSNTQKSILHLYLKYTLSILTRSILKVLYFWSLKKYT